MDTLTHALAGALIGETASRMLPGTEHGLSAGARRGLFIPLMVIGSNLPDMDFVYSLVTGSKLDYLLHHRGHTHTLPGMVLAAVLMFFACEAWIRWRRLSTARSDHLWLAALALLAPVLHVAMDSTNTFGVHPFWPFDSHWYYGDSVFIIEPLFWTAAAPMFFLLRTLASRIAAAILMLAVMAWVFNTGLVPPISEALLVVLTLLMLAVGRYTTPRAALLTGIGLWAAVTLMFIAAHGVARQRVEMFSSQHYPDARTLDHALSPMPVNPVCWEVVLMQLQSDQYLTRRAMLSLAPDWIPAARCPQRHMNDRTTAPLRAVADAGAPNWKWYGELALPRGELAHLAAERCEAAAFMRFSRAPWALHTGNRWILGDLRYDREPEQGFGEIELADRAVHCPAHIPPWIPPRRELL